MPPHKGPGNEARLANFTTGHSSMNKEMHTEAKEITLKREYDI
jgi:hypothetical protein